MTGARTPVPIYSRIREEIRQQILRGDLRPGNRIPSEEKLASRYGISRMTARHAVTQLVQEGYLYRVHGKGTFVCKPKVGRSAGRLQGFADDMEKRGYTVRSEVQGFRRFVPGQEIREKLDLARGGEAYELIRVRYVSDVPTAYQMAYLPAGLFPGLDRFDFSQERLYRVLETCYDTRPFQADQAMGARDARGEIARALEVPVGTALLFDERRTLREDGRVMDLSWSWHRCDQYVFEVRLYRDGFPESEEQP